MFRTPIFYYHSIGNIGPETLSVEVFREHLNLLRQFQFNTLTFSQLLNGRYDPALNHVVLSFDDGLLDNYDKAFPILQEFDFKATFFVIAEFDNVVRWVNPKSRRWSDEERDGYSIPFPSMHKHHRTELLDYGMEIGSHSLTHRKLNKLSQLELRAEIFESKAKLEDQHGIEVTSFCFPKGRYNDTVVRLLEEADYQGACTTMPGYFRNETNKFECGRFLVEKSSLFKTILKYASFPRAGIDHAFAAIRPILKIKNTLF